MPGIGLKNPGKTLKKRRFASSDRGCTELTIHNVWATTSPLDVVLLLWREGFHPLDAEVQMLFADASDLAHAVVTLPRGEVRAAQRWANNRWWRGLEMYAKFEDEGDDCEDSDADEEVKLKVISHKETDG